ncbi:FKBP-type peptidyl-prolyl cis-trans isomerase [Mariniphaga anaerophila]|uniref:Peptidyl-prolyl cis-trans isomerase n=1 Tax=Mariniphaga anaerophila TaxID=1484053 RepID=A0A1M4W9F3_9BACT|nr:FKBP-type peptidyl-prolyl cis-trans isomerase [Mariniphaga anaerophila]SHE77592.1 FKBP-type peptidyl-prolyl cis-trans isomerase [Mariniphaga anaerophila]
MSTKSVSFLFLAVALFFSAVVSCTPEEEQEPRTREQEWEELDAWMKKLEAEGEDIDTTDLMVFYTIRKPGEGPFPQIGDSCKVSYIGYKSDGGKIEDSSEIYPKGIWSFIYKPQHDVGGLIEGIGYMNKGAEVEMYIHSDFAFGAKGASGIPPFTTLIYRVTMNDMTPKK